MNWNHIIIDGDKRDLKHLRPFTFAFEIAGEGDKPGLVYEIDVAFSLHCFTRAPQNEDDTVLHLEGERRTFCETRYGHSFRLPEIIQSLDQRHVRQSGRGNYFTVEFIDEAGERLDYEVYFRLTKPGKRKNLRLFVESAYIRTKTDQFRNRKKKIRFKVLVNAVKHGRQIRI